MYSSIGIWDFGFFFVIFLIGILATYFHWTHAMHAIRRRGSVGANYWGNYASSKQGKDEGKFKLPKPSNKALTCVSGKAQSGCGARR